MQRDTDYAPQIFFQQVLLQKHPSLTWKKTKNCLSCLATSLLCQSLSYFSRKRKSWDTADSDSSCPGSSPTVRANRRCEQSLETSKSLGAMSNIWKLIFQIRHVACFAKCEAKARAAHLGLCWFSSGEIIAMERNISECPNRTMRLHWEASGCFPWISLHGHVRQTDHLTPYTPSAALQPHNHRGYC